MNALSSPQPGVSALPAPGGWTVARRLSVSLAALLLGLIAVAVAMQWRTLQVSDRALAGVIEFDQRWGEAVRWRGLEAVVAERSQALLNTSDGDLQMAYETANGRDGAEIDRLVQRLRQRGAGQPRALDALDQLQRERIALLAVFRQVNALAMAGDVGEVHRQVASQVQPAVQRYLAALDQFIDAQARARSAVQADAAAARRQLWGFSALAGLSVLGVAAVMAWRLTRSITVPLDEAVRWARQIAAGDLSDQPVTARGDEFGTFLAALGSMAAGLRQIVSEVRVGVAQVSGAASDIATGNHELSVRTEQSAIRAEATSAHLQTLVRALREAAEAARDAMQQADQAALQARVGDERVQQVSAQMNSIQQTSRQIDEITQTIDDIALQTQLLALNVASEAARAGAAGGGFTVVAQEVRRLAHRASEAARSIRQLIESAGERIAAGADGVSATRAEMSNIVACARSASERVRRLRDAAASQQDAVQALDQAVHVIEAMTQQNAALVEQSAAATASMRDQAQRLHQLMAQFRW